MFLKLLDRYITQGTLTVVEPDGHRHTFGQGEPHATWVLRNGRAKRRIFLNATANVGETYMDGDWDVQDGDLADLLTILRVNLEEHAPGRSTAALAGALASLLTSWNNVRASLSNVSHHYDLDEALFRAFLDTDMHYSCAYFREPDFSLEMAQAAKCDHIRRKLNVESGQRVLDIGCGWGSLAMHLAEHTEVDVVGLTLSSEPLRVARAGSRFWFWGHCSVSPLRRTKQPLLRPMSCGSTSTTNRPGTRVTATTWWRRPISMPWRSRACCSSGRTRRRRCAARRARR